MLRSLVAAGALACVLAAAPSASAQGVSVNIGVGTRPYYGSYLPRYGYEAPRYFDQRYYGDWRDHRGDLYRYPGSIRAPDYPRYPYPHHHHHHHCPPYWDGRYYIGR